MTVIHHNKLRVNAEVPDDSDQMSVLRESGWALGLHKDSDPDDPVLIRDPTALPRVLPEPEPDAETEDETNKSAAKKSSASKEK